MALFCRHAMAYAITFSIFISASVISASRDFGGSTFVATRSNLRRTAARAAAIGALVDPSGPAAKIGFGIVGSRRHVRTVRATSLLGASVASVSDKIEKLPVPVTLLAGFLGSGKTTTLKNLLENGEGIRVGVVVNDIASVNIDAKLISNPGNEGDPGDVVMGSGGTVELQNGCACCSLSDELLTSIETLLVDREFDHIVVELSGVADPNAVKQNWEEAKMVSLLFGVR